MPCDSPMRKAVLHRNSDASRQEAEDKVSEPLSKPVKIFESDWSMFSEPNEEIGLTPAYVTQKSISNSKQPSVGDHEVAPRIVNDELEVLKETISTLEREQSILVDRRVELAEAPMREELEKQKTLLQKYEEENKLLQNYEEENKLLNVEFAKERTRIREEFAAEKIMFSEQASTEKALLKREFEEERTRLKEEFMAEKLRLELDALADETKLRKEFEEEKSLLKQDFEEERRSMKRKCEELQQLMAEQAEPSDLEDKERSVAHLEAEMQRLQEVVEGFQGIKVRCDKMTKQKASLETKLKEGQDKEAKMEERIKTITADLNQERVTAKKFESALALEHESWKVERGKLEKQIETLSKTVDEQATAFWDQALTTAPQNASAAASNPSAPSSPKRKTNKKKSGKTFTAMQSLDEDDDPNTKLLQLDEELRTSCKERDLLRVRLNEVQTELSRSKAKAKAKAKNASIEKITVEQPKSEYIDLRKAKIVSKNVNIVLVVIIALLIVNSFR